jgi:hypothetical protein
MKPIMLFLSFVFGNLSLCSAAISSKLPDDSGKPIRIQTFQYLHKEGLIEEFSLFRVPSLLVAEKQKVLEKDPPAQKKK